jgi:hypothetical protein
MESRQVKCLFSGFSVTPAVPFFAHPITKEPIFAHFDPPHLFKCIRNNFMNYDILVSIVVCLFSYTLDRLELDTSGLVTVHPH